MMYKISFAKKTQLETRQATIVPYKSVGAKELKMYVYLPKKTPTGCVLCFHGGGWRSETPMRLAPHAAYFAENGAIGISVEYRLIGDGIDLRDSLKDCVDALVFVRKHIKEHYGNLPITSFGDSAGAYFAVCLGNQEIMNRIGAGGSIVDYIVDLNGIVDLTGKWNYGILEKNKKIKKEIEKNFSPLYNVKENDSAILIVHGKEDKTVAVADSEQFYETLQEKGVSSELILLEHVAHAFILFDYRHENAYVEEVLTMIGERLKDKGVL